MDWSFGDPEEHEDLEEPRTQKEPKTPEIQEEPKTPEAEEKQPELFKEAKREKSVSEQQIFEKIHEELVYDTIEQNLSNLIDIEPEGTHETKEMTSELEKKMAFRFRVHTTHPTELKKSVKELIDHFRRKTRLQTEKGNEFD